MTDSAFFNKNDGEGFICFSFRVFEKYLLSFDVKNRKMVVMDMGSKSQDTRENFSFKNHPAIYKISNGLRTKKHKLIFDSFLIFYSPQEFLVFDYK